MTGGCLPNNLMNENKKWRSFLSLVLACTFRCANAVPPACAPTILKDPMIRDLVMASERVSWNDESFQGTTGSWYETIATCEMERYDTRMRMYQKKDEDTVLVMFRPTQQTWNGGSIHAERRVATNRFLDTDSSGNVHERFQEAFLQMHDECAPHLRTLVDQNQTFYVAGHSLGGSFSLFMAHKLFYDYDVTPRAVYGFAGTFIGDETFHTTLQAPMRNDFPLWLIEVVDINNPDNRDGTSEGYQTSDNQLYIDPSMICGFYIVPLGPDQSYGMHDLKNYWKAVQSP